MHKTKKQLLGLAGLAIVAVMTAIAITLPAPGASAADKQTTQITVQVVEGETNVSFVEPSSGMRTVKSTIHAKVNYSQANKIQYKLIPLDKDGNDQADKAITIGDFDVSGSGTDEHDFNLADYGLSYGEYKLQATATGNSNPVVDTTQFSYNAMIVTNTNRRDQNGDPIFEVEISEGVNSVEMHVYDGDKAMFIGADGKQERVVLTRADINAETGKILVALPFAKYNIPTGRYKVISVAYDADNKDLAESEITIDYQKGAGPTVDPDDPSKPTDPDTPDTPNTGALLEDMSISRLDYLLTGLIAFGAVAGFAIYLIHRRDRR